MFISKGCLIAILDNLSVLNREVEELKKATDFDAKLLAEANVVNNRCPNRNNEAPIDEIVEKFIKR